MLRFIKLFKKHSDYEEYINSSDKTLPNVSLCDEEDEMHYEPKPYDYSKDYLTFVALGSGTFTFEPKNNNVIRYSTDNGENWTEGNSVSVNSGDKVMWKGTMTPEEWVGIGTFSSTGNFDVQGNSMSLLFGDNYKGEIDLTGKDNAFYQLFYVNTKIVNAENLSLPATTLADYCYSNMFNSCTSLETAPPVLPATALTNQCYIQMFSGCTSLTIAPKLPATTLAINCYSNMFQGCTSLTTAPELPATTLADYCYNYMFKGCTNLNYIKAMFTRTPGTRYTNSWLYGVSATGTFVKNAAATWTTTGVYGVPTGWDVQTAST